VRKKKLLLFPIVPISGRALLCLKIPRLHLVAVLIRIDEYGALVE
jgi:hypothetical protein